MNEAGPSYILGRGAGNLTFFQCCSTPSKTKQTSKKTMANFLPCPWELLLGREHLLPAELSGAGLGRALLVPTERSFPFPTSQGALDGMRGWRGGTTNASKAALPLGGSTGGSFGPCQTHLGQVPEADLAIASLNPGKREGNPPPSPSLLPLLHFNVSWNVHSLFLSGCTVHNIWKALSQQLMWGEKGIVLIHDDYLDLKQQHREGYLVCNLTRSAQDFPTVLFLRM